MPDSISRLSPVKKVPMQNELPQPTPFTTPQIVPQSPNYMDFEEPKFDLKDVTVEELAIAANVSVETIKHAIYVREQQMKAEYRARLAAKLRQEFMRTSTVRTTTTTTSTTTRRPQIVFKSKADDNNGIGFENKVSKVS